MTACSKCGIARPEIDEEHRTCFRCRHQRQMVEQRAMERDRSGFLAKRAAWARARYWRNPEKARAQFRVRRMAKKTEGVCLDCSQSIFEDALYCEKHLMLHRKASAMWMRKLRKSDPDKARRRVREAYRKRRELKQLQRRAV